MSKTFRPWKIDEPLLLPPVVQEFVAKDHLARNRGKEKWFQNFAQGDKWNFCLTAGAVVPANQERP
jgi:hypothetical protein